MKKTFDSSHEANVAVKQSGPTVTVSVESLEAALHMLKRADALVSATETLASLVKDRVDLDEAQIEGIADLLDAGVSNYYNGLGIRHQHINALREHIAPFA